MSLIFGSTIAQVNYYLLDGDTVWRMPQDMGGEPLDVAPVSFIDYNTILINQDLYRLDSISASLFFKETWYEDDVVVHQSIYMHKSEIPQFTEAEVREKLALIPAEVELPYNKMTQQIIDLFTGNRRHFISKAVGFSEYYFPIYEEVLDRHQMPIELKYLSVIESGLNPKARSNAGASGPWQFMSRTGKAYGLDNNSFVDERSDIYKSTEAAATYLNDLYNMYGDWLLAMAAYNAGPGNVNKAMAKAGNDKSFWGIRSYLPRETQNYVPLFIGCVYAMTYYEDYAILPLKPNEELFATDTVLVKEKLSLKYVSQTLGIDQDYLVYINPSLKQGIIPKSVEGYSLNLPITSMSQFVANQSLFDHDPYMMEEIAELIEVAEPSHTVYSVKSGDTLGHIAERHNVGLSKIKQWNNLYSDKLKIGQKLTIYQ